MPTLLVTTLLVKKVQQLPNNTHPNDGHVTDLIGFPIKGTYFTLGPDIIYNHQCIECSLTSLN